MEIKPEQHRYPFLASLLCIPSQDAIIENEGAAGPAEDDGSRMREARGLARMSDADAATAAAWSKGCRQKAGASRRMPRAATLPQHSEVRWATHPNVPDSDDIPAKRGGRRRDFEQLLSTKSPVLRWLLPRCETVPRSIKRLAGRYQQICVAAACVSRALEERGGRRRRAALVDAVTELPPAPERRTPPSPHRSTRDGVFVRTTP